MLTDQTFYPVPFFLVGESVFFDEQGRLEFPLVLGFNNAIREMEFRLAVVASVPPGERVCSRILELRQHRLPALFWRDFNPSDANDLFFLRQTVHACDFVLCPELPAEVVVPRAKQVSNPWNFMAALQRLAMSPVPYSAEALRALYD